MAYHSTGRIRLARSPRLPRWPGWTPVVAVVIFACAVLLVTHFSEVTGRKFTLCLFKNLTGIPCPGCGGSRAAMDVLHGDWLGAIAMNPLLVATGLCLAVVMILRLAAGRKVVLELTRGQTAVVVSAAALLMLANWAYLIACGR